MDAVALIIGLALLLVSVYLVGAPLLRPVEAEGNLLSLGEGDSLEREKESVFTTLGEIEFDYQMRKLSQKDYEELRDYYRREAVSIVKQEEVEVGGGEETLVMDEKTRLEIEREIQEELERLRNEKPPGTE